MSHDILLIEPSPGHGETSRGLLERAGYDVREILSIDGALESARKAPPMAIVIESPEDALVPRRFMVRLRRHPKTHSVPVIVVGSGRDRAPVEEEVGVTWLPEPCPPRTLLEEVAYLTRPPAGLAAKEWG